MAVDRIAALVIRAFLAVASQWRLSAEQQQRILGSPSPSTYRRWIRQTRANGSIRISSAVRRRIRLVFLIHQALAALFETQQSGTDWLWLPHQASPFNGRRPLELLESGTIDGLVAVLRFLEGASQGIYMPPNSVDVEFAPYRDDEIIVSGNEQNPPHAEAFASDKDSFAHRLLERRGTIGRDIDLEFSDKPPEPRVAPLSYWLRTHQPAGFAGETVLQLIEGGRAPEVLEYLDAIRARVFS